MIRGTIFLENIESQEEIYDNANIVLSVSWYESTYFL